ncbi:Co2+/Mg2+ efflux protein ApaG [Aureimonas leprariae]|uniref:Protein ApaG n=1 Tax=Plantimonas leprariae TaxID=2615207 RepID=A0A7V7PL21_9HYPH|nr:Co2+/Mg2+ efflux protein ApaG [Aureimonas leprariae]KAB0676583.1 Co2+/Mg2+ efflux protein ApaG [Aureimonas leprariae]
MFKATTHGITVSVTPTFLEAQSDPDGGRWVWAYTIAIENGGEDTVQLRSRHWRITDARGHVEEVRGPGVVGEQPLLPPGDSFTYTSGCPLPTPSGFMEGAYRMERQDGTSFEVAVPAFSLDLPAETRVLN